MIQSSKTFRIFVSSTFSDMKVERNALQKDVFPRLRKLCMQHGCRFQAIDLRWGVSEEAALDQQIMRICLEEIERCQKVSPRPNFIVLLGDRYGWQPLPYEIPACEYEKIIGAVSPDDHRLLDLWYRRDDNAAPPAYVLQPRDWVYENSTVWGPTEKKLQSILRNAVDRLDLSADVRIRYFSSATEQEIIKGCLNTPGSGKHVFCFFRNFSEPPEGEDTAEFIDLDDEGQIDTIAHSHLKGLKDRLRKALPGNVHDYEAQWTGKDSTTDYMEQFCSDVYDELADIIRAEIKQIEKVDPLDKEITDHETFGRERAQHFTGRNEILGSALSYVRSGNNQPLCIYGEGGSGKSAFMAHATEQIKNTTPHAHVICRFIGATPSSINIISLLDSLCRQIARAYGRDESCIPTDHKELVETLLKYLVSFTDERFPLVMLIDALDQLSDMKDASNLAWLPFDLPPSVRIIVSALETAPPVQSLAVLQRKLPAYNLLKLSTMTGGEGEELLDSWLADARRILQPSQKEEILSRFTNNGLPLYLKLAFEEAKRWKSYDKATSLSNDIEGIIKDLFERLSLDANHGNIMVSHSLGYLAAARNGLTEDELLDLLSVDSEVMDDFRQRSPKSPPVDRLPVAAWSRLYLDLKPYLAERSADNTSLMYFFHRIFDDVTKRDSALKKSKEKRHRALANYFGSLPFGMSEHDSGSIIPNFRKITELPFQLYKSNDWEGLSVILGNIIVFNVLSAETRFYELIEYLAILKENNINIGRLYVDALTSWANEKDDTVFERLIKIGYALADQLAEECWLVLWKQYCKTARVPQTNFLIHYSRYLHRSGKQEEALTCLENAEKDSSNIFLKYQCALEIVQVLSFSGKSRRATLKAETIMADYGNIISSDGKASAYFYHQTSFPYHELDKNEDFASYNEKARQFYKNMNSRYEICTTTVNIGDGFWGSGDEKRARYELEFGYDMACEWNISHAKDISALCLANYFASVGIYDRALSLYNEGIALAKTIGHAWDEIYGHIYRLLAISELYHEDNYETFLDLAKKSDDKGYGYLADIARTYALINLFMIEKLNRHHLTLIMHSLTSQIPAAVAYIASISMLTSVLCELIDNCNVEELFYKSLNEMQGIKGRPGIILAALELGQNKSQPFIELKTKWKKRYNGSSILLEDRKRYQFL